MRDKITNVLNDCRVDPEIISYTTNKLLELIARELPKEKDRDKQFTAEDDICAIGYNQAVKDIREKLQ